MLTLVFGTYGVSFSEECEDADADYSYRYDRAVNAGWRKYQADMGLLRTRVHVLVSSRVRRERLKILRMGGLRWITKMELKM